jgi:hypothetical protein
MDGNREWYQQVRKEYLAFAQELITLYAGIEP